MATRVGETDPCNAVLDWVWGAAPEAVEIDLPDARAHLDRCATCRRALEERVFITRMLRSASRRLEAPTSLSTRVLTDIEREQIAKRVRFRIVGLCLAASLVLAGAAVWYVLPHSDGPVEWARREHLLAPSLGAPRSEIVSRALTSHVFCDVDRPLQTEAMQPSAVRDRIGGRFASLVTDLANRLPPDLVLVGAHECVRDGRAFLHIRLADAFGRVSVFVSRSDGGSVEARGASIIGQESDANVGMTRLDGVKVYLLDTPEYFAFTISGSDDDSGLSAAKACRAAILDSGD